jgi:copper homeostasis protein
LIIEAAVESLEGARAAVEGGAHRIELCTDLAHGGTTPIMRLVRKCTTELTIPVFVLVRPRPGNYVYIHLNFLAMLKQVYEAKAAGAHGIVTGALTESNDIDERQTAELVTTARPLPVTFHRAFDECRDPMAALETLIRLGVQRVLTSGGAATADQGAERIGELVRQSQGRIEILAGGGVNSDNVARLVQVSGVREIHFSVKEADKVRGIRSAMLPHAGAASASARVPRRTP